MNQKEIDAVLMAIDHAPQTALEAELAAAYREHKQRADALADAVEEFKMQMADEGELFRALDKYRGNE